MKKNYYFLIVLLLFFSSCEKNTESKNEIIIEEELTKEDQLKKLYTTAIITMFNNFKDVEIPTEFRVDANDNSINAGASFGYVEVSQGLVNNEGKFLQIYVLSHEVAHIVTINQASIFDLGDQIPNGSITNAYKKSEYLADLIAIHLMNKKLNSEFELLIADFTSLENLLGTSTFTHPSGIERVVLMKTYLSSCEKLNKDEAFRQLFKQVWEME